MITIGQKAPQFSLPDKDGNIISLESFLGKKVILYFYPKDNTPGCTNQSIGFSNLKEEFDKLNAVVIGISKDSQKSHANFIQKHSLNVILLSDEEKVAINLYNVWQEKKLYGKLGFGVVRSTFIIDEKGFISHVFEKVNAGKNPQQILDTLSNL